MNSFKTTRSNSQQLAATRSNSQQLAATRWLLLFLALFVPFSLLKSQTLCSVYGGNTPDYIVGVGTSYPSSSSLPSSVISNATILVLDNFIVDNSFTLYNCIVKVSFNKKIAVTFTDYVNFNPTNLTLNNTKVFSNNNGICNRWIGIQMNSFTGIVVTNNSQVEDADIAIQASNTSFVGLAIDHSTFNRNKIGISLEDNGLGGWYVVPPMISYFVGNTFSCTSNLNNPSSTTSDVGLQIKGVPYPLVYNYANSQNTFRQLKKGVTIEGSYSSFDINNYLFEQISESGVEFTGGDYLAVTNSTFNNPTKYGILFKNARALVVDRCSFQSTTSPVTTNFRYNVSIIEPITGNNIEIKNNTFSTFGNLSGFRLACVDIGFGSTISSPTLDYTTNIRNNNFFLKNNNAGATVYGVYLGGNHSANSSNLILNNAFDTNTSINNNTNYSKIISIGVGGQKYNTKVITNIQVAGVSKFCVFNGSTGTGNEITGNIINKGIAPFLGYFIDVGSNQNLKICSNLDNAASAVGYFFTSNNLGMNFTSNTSYGSSSGTTNRSVFINFDNPIIGAQFHKGNEWYPSNCYPGSGICHPRITYTDGTTPELSKFTVNTNQSPLNSSINNPLFSAYFPGNITPNPTTSQFFVTLPGSPDLGCVPQLISGRSPIFSFNYGTSSIVERVEDGDDVINDPLIAKNGLADYFTNPTRQYDVKMHLYRKIKKTPTARLSNGIYTEFISKHEKENVGKTFDIEQNLNDVGKMDALVSSSINTLKEQVKALDDETKKYSLKNKPTKAVIEDNYKKRMQIARDIESEYQKHDNNKKSKLKEGKKIIDGFAPKSTPEGFVKDVYQIYFDVKVNQNGQITVDQNEKLKKIASMCPSEGGMIVFVARGFLSSDDLFEIRNVLQSCEPKTLNLIETKEFLSVPQQETPIKSEFVIYPNPSKETFDINLLEADAGTMQMTDISGKIVNNFNLKNGTNNIQHNLPNGVYIVNVKTDKGQSSIQKIIVRN
jgi:Secretion system C-terminal sorting domain